jgi:hypothetical protein
MKELFVESAQHAASGKAAMAVGIGTLTAPSWLQWINGLVSSDYFGSLLIVLGALVSITIVIVNVQSIIIKTQTRRETVRQERIRTALLEQQAKERNIEID